jgi:septum formation protein
MQTCPLILASGSWIRNQLLTNAGLQFQICKPDVDERALAAKYPDAGPAEIAMILAKAKALAQTHPKEALVIGGDQVLEVDGQTLDKVDTMQAAKERLWALRGRCHYLTGASVLARNDQIIWQHKQRSKVCFRNFSETALETYLAETGERILASVGCYELEAQGIGLVSKLEGDHSAMLGLPLLPLLQALRDFGGLET